MTKMRKRIRVAANALDIPAHFRLPLDLAARFRGAEWNGVPIEVHLEHGFDSDFICLEHRLDGGELLLRLAPHPDKGRGTTQVVYPDNLATTGVSPG